MIVITKQPESFRPPRKHAHVARSMKEASFCPAITEQAGGMAEASHKKAPQKGTGTGALLGLVELATLARFASLEGIPLYPLLHLGAGRDSGTRATK